jgi:hypothetical protein
LRSPLAALAERLRRRRPGDPDAPATPSPPLPRTMALGAQEFRSRLDEARERLRREIPPPHGVE